MLKSIIFFHAINIVLNLQFLMMINEDALSVISRTILETALTSIELQIWIIIYILTLYFQSLNEKLECYLNRRNMNSDASIIRLRQAFENLTELSFEINQIYNLNILLILCLHNIYEQFDIYKTLEDVYNLVLNGTSFNFFVDIQWTSFNIIRIFLYFYICTEAVKEVSYLNCNP